jgi:ureidoacrylate peracid hydrolase
MEEPEMNERVLSTLDEKIDPKHTAVVIIDVQNDFCHEEGYLRKLGLDISASQAMIPTLENFIAAARKTEARVVFVQGIYNNRYLSGPFMDKDRKGGLTVERCMEGTWGADFYRVSPLPYEDVVQKHRYSAFAGTHLDALLKQAGIQTLILAGVTTNVCVESTARDGFMRDYYIVFLSDCTATYNPDVHESTLRNIDRHFGMVADSTAVIKCWAGSGVLNGIACQ